MTNKTKLIKQNINNDLLKNLKAFSNRDILLKHLPKHGIVAELGVNTGNFSSKILKINQPKKLHLIDMWETKRYNENKFLSVSKKFSNEIKSLTIEINRGKSTDLYVNFPDNYFDWIYIDTNHTYSTTLQELNLYKNKIKKEGFISGHDFVKGNIKNGFVYGVIDAVYEFCNANNWEMIYITLENKGNPSFAIRRKESN